MNICSVHKYKHSQENRRKLLKRLMKDTVLKLLQVTKTHFQYEIVNMSEYVKRTKGVNRG